MNPVELLPLVLIVLAFWLLLIRPQKRRQQELARIQNTAEIGREVMLSSGIFGTVAALDDEFVHLEVAPGVQLKAVRGAIVRVVDPVEDSLEESVPESDGRATGTAADNPVDPTPGT